MFDQKNPLYEVADQKRMEYWTANKNTFNGLSTIMYMIGSEVKIGGALQSEKYPNSDIKVGTFQMSFPNGRKISIPNVRDAYFGLEASGKFKFFQANRYFVLDEDDLEKTDFYIFQLVNVPNKKNKFYCHDIHVYHGSYLVDVIHNTEAKIKPVGPLKFFYTAINTSNGKNEHCLYDHTVNEKLATNNKSLYHTIDDFRTELLNQNNYSAVDNDYINIYFHIDGSKPSLILKEFCQKADFFQQVENCFEDDETVNYLARFKKNRLNDIAFAFYCFSNKPFGGLAIYNIPNAMYLLGTDNKELKLAMEDWMYSENQIESYKILLMDLYGKYGETFNSDKLPDKMPHKEVTADGQLRSVFQFLNENHPAYMSNVTAQLNNASKKITEYEYSGTLVFRELLDQFKTFYAQIFVDLITRGDSKVRWVAEFSLFTIIHKIYPDAIYQYRAKWLSNQSLDVFIPSIGIGVEYQGIQHYHPVELFGGMNGYLNRVELDKNKRRLCQQNDVKLIEWHYEEPISKAILEKKISELTK